jgi:type I site-specific restriction endonuclease
VALIEGKKDTLPPGHGLDQAKGYQRAGSHNVLFVFSSNGHQFVEFDRTTGMTTTPRPMSEFAVQPRRAVGLADQSRGNLHRHVERLWKCPPHTTGQP